MIKDFVKAWDKNKEKLRAKYKQTTPEWYDETVKDLIEIVINPYLEEDLGKIKLDIESITCVNDGEYQGTLLYIIPIEEYQPLVKDYFLTWVEYGSCSVCDTLQRIIYDSKSQKEKIEGLMTLALHILQNFKKLYE